MVPCRTKNGQHSSRNVSRRFITYSRPFREFPSVTMTTKWIYDEIFALLTIASLKELTVHVKKWLSILLTYIDSWRSLPPSPQLSQISIARDQGRVSTQKQSNAIPFIEIPERKGWPLVGNMWEYYQNLGRTHKLLKERSETYGPIFKEKVGSTEIVFLSSMKDVDRMWKMEGRHPRHFDVPPWLEYRCYRHRACGILTAQGEDWYRMRQEINKRMLRTKHVAGFCLDFNTVTEDFLNRLSKVRNQDNVIEKLEEEVLLWALESTGTFLFERRLGCLDDEPDNETVKFIRAACDVFKLTQKLIYLPPLVAKVLMYTTWKQHTECWDTLFSLAQRFVDERITELERNGAEGQEGGLLTHLLSQSNLSREEIYANVIELLIGGIHTSTKVLQWLTYELSKNLSSQETLHEEVCQRAPSRASITTSQLDSMSFLQAVLTETLRLYPVAGGIPRVLTEEITLSGYTIPKGTNVMVLSHVIGRDAKVFEKPDSFCPERWLVNDLTATQTSLINLPFGMGSRMCVGKRVAQAQIGILLARLCQKFVLESETSEVAEIQSCLLLQPDRPIRVRFLERE